MEIKRTANAGVLLKLDGVSILLDGVCREVKPYLATPPEEKKRLMQSWPDVLAFTHIHKDHYDPGFAASFREHARGVILGPKEIAGSSGMSEPVSVGTVSVTQIPSRHIGKEGQTIDHCSFIVRGSACVWFLGDASPLQWKGREGLPSPDVLIVPYAYAATGTGWEITKRIGAKTVVLLHMPEKANDPVGLWPAVQAVTEADAAVQLLIPEMGETLSLDKSFVSW